MMRQRSKGSLTVPAPIIKTRIPIELKKVFLASQRGEDVLDAPPSASKTFRIWQGYKVSKSNSDTESDATSKKNCRLMFGENNVVDIESRRNKPKGKCRWSSEVSKVMTSVDPPRHVSPLTTRHSCDEVVEELPGSGRWKSVGRDESSNMPRLPGRQRSSQNVMRDVQSHCRRLA